MTRLCFGLFVGYCYDLDYSLIVDIGVSVITVIFLGINSVIKLVRCQRTRLSPVQPLLGNVVISKISYAHARSW